MIIYVGNISRKIGSKQLREEFGAYGHVKAVNNRGTFAFVHMADPWKARSAIHGLNESCALGKGIEIRPAKRRKTNTHFFSRHLGVIRLL